MVKNKDNDINMQQTVNMIQPFVKAAKEIMEGGDKNNLTLFNLYVGKVENNFIEQSNPHEEPLEVEEGVVTPLLEEQTSESDIKKTRENAVKDAIEAQSYAFSQKGLINCDYHLVEDEIVDMLEQVLNELPDKNKISYLYHLTIHIALKKHRGNTNAASLWLNCTEIRIKNWINKFKLIGKKD